MANYTIRIGFMHVPNAVNSDKRCEIMEIVPIVVLVANPSNDFSNGVIVPHGVLHVAK